MRILISAIFVAILALNEQALGQDETTTAGGDAAFFVESNDTASKVLQGTFDCRRVGHDCDINGGTCDLDTGLCACNENYTGVICDIHLFAISNTSLCNNGTGCSEDPDAYCYKLPEVSPATDSPRVSDYACSCPYSYFGKACEKPRVELRCSSNFLSITVQPYSSTSFDGQLFVIDSNNYTKISEPACTFSDLTLGPASLRLSYSDVVTKCGGRASGNTSHEFTFIVQTDSEWLTQFDQMIIARCSQNVSREYPKTIIVDAGSMSRIEPGGPHVSPQLVTAQVSYDLSNVAIDHLNAERKRVEFLTVLPRPIITLWQEFGPTIRPINGSVKIGDVVIVKIENVNDTYFTALRPEECTLRMDESMTANLIKDHCPASRLAWILLMWSKTEVTNVSVSLYLRLPANALAGQPRQLTIGCRVKLCAEDMVDQCAMAEDDCKNTTTGNHFLLTPRHPSRKRRSAHDESTAYAYVKKTFEVEYDDEDQPINFPKKVRVHAASSATCSDLSALSLLALIAAKWYL